MVSLTDIVCNIPIIGSLSCGLINWIVGLSDILYNLIEDLPNALLYIVWFAIIGISNFVLLLLICELFICFFSLLNHKKVHVIQGFVENNIALFHATWKFLIGIIHLVGSIVQYLTTWIP